MTKHVVSSTLDKVEWTGSKLVKGDVASEMRKLKKEPSKDLCCRAARNSSALMRENLIDLYRFMAHPIVLRKGKHPLAGGADERKS